MATYFHASKHSNLSPQLQLPSYCVLSGPTLSDSKESSSVNTWHLTSSVPSALSSGHWTAMPLLLLYVLNPCLLQPFMFKQSIPNIFQCIYFSKRFSLIDYPLYLKESNVFPSEKWKQKVLLIITLIWWLCLVQLYSPLQSLWLWIASFFFQ